MLEFFAIGHFCSIVERSVHVSRNKRVTSSDNFRRSNTPEANSSIKLNKQNNFTLYCVVIWGVL